MQRSPFVDVGVPDFREESQGGRVVGVVCRELDVGLEISPLVQSVRRPEESHLPEEHVLVIEELDSESLHGVLS